MKYLIVNKVYSCFSHNQWSVRAWTQNQEFERTAVNPTKSFCKIFPEVAGVTNAYVRAAQDFKKATERHRLAEMKNRVLKPSLIFFSYCNEYTLVKKSRGLS